MRYENKLEMLVEAIKTGGQIRVWRNDSWSTVYFGPNVSREESLDSVLKYMREDIRAIVPPLSDLERKVLEGRLAEGWCLIGRNSSGHLVFDSEDYEDRTNNAAYRLDEHFKFIGNGETLQIDYLLYKEPE